MTTLQWVDATGKKEPLRAKPGAYSQLSLSPDGKRVALPVLDGGSRDIWVYDPQRDAMTRLTFVPKNWQDFEIIVRDAQARHSGGVQPSRHGREIPFPHTA